MLLPQPCYNTFVWLNLVQKNSKPVEVQPQFWVILTLVMYVHRYVLDLDVSATPLFQLF